jgi:hypothetical protein
MSLLEFVIRAYLVVAALPVLGLLILLLLEVSSGSKKKQRLEAKQGEVRHAVPRP